MLKQKEKESASLLIVDDEPKNIQLLGTILTQEGYQIEFATNGEETLEWMKSGHFDLILLDIMMPGMDGYEVCRRIKKEDQIKEIPIIFLTAKADADSIIHGFEVGASDYISKPFNKRELLVRVDTHLELNLERKKLREMHRDLEQAHDQLEQQHQQLKIAKEIAELANRSKSEFLANMSHEIRTPMNAILGFTEILGGLIDDPRQQEYLNTIKTSGRSLLNLINDILDLSKVEAGKMELEYKVCNPHHVFQEMKVIFSQMVEDRDLEFILEIDPLLPEALIFDELRLHQVLLNLINNAIKFTEIGHVKLCIQCLVTESNKDLLNLIITVEDTGIGIPKEQLKHIFGAFEQQLEQSHAKFGGTGLGLAISKGLIDIMGGQLSVTSEEKKGSIFKVALEGIKIAPACDLKQSDTNDVDLSKVQFDPAKILITDDVELNRRLAIGFLEPYSFTIIEAENGKEAVELTKKKRPDLILMDMKMPVMDGYEAIDTIKADTSTKGIPIIGATASAMKQSEEKVRAVCDGYISKPMNKRGLVRELMRFLKYTIEDTVTESDQVDANRLLEIKPDVLEKLPSLIDILEEKMNSDDFKEMVSVLAISDIEQFGKEMGKLGVQYDYFRLQQWAEQLESQAVTFNIKALKESLGDIAEIINQAKALIQSH